MEALLAIVQQQSKTTVTNTKFGEFDPSVELWTDYWARFESFTKANAIPDERRTESFLTNQSSAIYKLVMNLAQQQTPPRVINSHSMGEIAAHMAEQYNPKRFVARKRFKFWTKTARKPGESVNALAAHIRQEAATCDFASIKDPLDEAMRTRFVCSIHNEAIIKALFKIKDDELTFTRAFEIAAEVEEATRVAKETLGSPDTEIHKVLKKKPPAKSSYNKPAAPHPNFFQRNPSLPHSQKGPQLRRCSRCDRAHSADTCRFATVTCRFCNIKGHIESACRKKKRQQHVKIVKAARGSSTASLTQECFLSGYPINFEVDTDSRDSFILLDTWHQINRPQM
ncbi:transposon tf2-6 polyprotein [Plakobranchus ocellatus]|uniref:Transposon tf2-6 polyprotein n=1 Tax=Plakobranchus ocellatus TaxID=259542 RepID=A0AAV3ZIU6_9GAST|nr:transposon tf2-6 polyprotein [Plakobranchus ocellatus]